METTGEMSGTVLVVDDDEGVRRVLVRWVSDIGHVVKAAESAEKALEIISEGGIDVALCDVRMPGRDGIWLIGQLGRLHPDIAIVLATGLVEMDPMVTLRPGVVGYIVKPFNRQDLSQVVTRAMAERRRLQAEHRAAPRRLPAGAVDGQVISRG
jgi:DNA-binding NtrC family response regulator